MDAYTCIRTKRDTRLYQSKPIPEQSLRRILQAGRMAGSAKNLQPCRFVVLQDTPMAGSQTGHPRSAGGGGRGIVGGGASPVLGPGGQLFQRRHQAQPCPVQPGEDGSLAEADDSRCRRRRVAQHVDEDPGGLDGDSVGNRGW